MLVNATENRLSPKRVAVAALLGLAMLGTRYLPKHAMLVNEPEPRFAFAEDASDTALSITGHNSLLGDASPDQTADAVSTAELGQYHLNTSTVISQAGIEGIVERLKPASDELTLAANDSTGGIQATGASAVPEPTAASFLALAVAPMLILRRPRIRRDS